MKRLPDLLYVSSLLPLCISMSIFCLPLSAQTMASIASGENTFVKHSSNHTAPDNPIAPGNECLYETGLRTIGTAGRYFLQIGRPEKFNRYQWEFHIVQGDGLHFFALPDGRVAIFNKLASAVSRKDQLAYLVGHALGHILSGHQPGNRRQKRPPNSPFSARAWSGMENIEQMITGHDPAYTRAEEREADQISLTLMRLGGYDLNESINFWETMKNRRASERGKPLVSVKSLDARINELKKSIPVIVAQNQALQKEEEPNTSCQDFLHNVVDSSDSPKPAHQNLQVPKTGNHIFVLVEVVPTSGLQKERITRLQELGTVYLDDTIIDGFNYTRVLLGDCASVEKAKEKQALVMETGVKTPLIVEYADGKKIGIRY